MTESAGDSQLETLCCYVPTPRTASGLLTFWCAPASMGYSDPPWHFKGRALYQLSLVPADEVM